MQNRANNSKLQVPDDRYAAIEVLDPNRHQVLWIHPGTQLFSNAVERHIVEPIEQEPMLPKELFNVVKPFGLLCIPSNCKNCDDDAIELRTESKDTAAVVELARAGPDHFNLCCQRQGA